MQLSRRDFLRAGILTAGLFALNPEAAAFSLSYKRPYLLQQVENATIKLVTVFATKKIMKAMKLLKHHKALAQSLKTKTGITTSPLIGMSHLTKIMQTKATKA